METQFWLERWRQGRIGFHQTASNPWLVRYFKDLRIPADSRVLVPLCGKSLDMLWIAEQGYRVLGVELSPVAVASFFQENEFPVDHENRNEFISYRSGPIEILLGDFFDLKAGDLNGVVGIYDRAALVALPPDLRRRYASHLGAIVSAGLRILLLSFEYPEGFREGPPFSVTASEVEKLFSESFDIQLLHTEIDGLGSMTEKIFLLERKPVR
jgi:thiopurine S-methyltransferase